MGRTELSNERWSCTETSNFYSVVAPQSESARYPALNKPVQHLCRTGSGASEVLDVAENIIGTAEASKSCKLARSRFKGVVAQPNARWGSQIYQKSRRIWLGTFSLEEEAARAYDAAAKRFRGADAITNFKSEREHHVKEMAFLMSHSEDEIVSMLQKHTYEDQLEQISRLAENGDEDDVGLVRTIGPVAIQYYNREGARTRELLFEKTLTHSDVGRLNRLVIPKVLAEKYFPAQEDDICSKDMLMTFQDTRGKLWRFRYSYWKSSQNYVLTKGWFRFVREKNLKAGDVVSFQQSTGWDRQWFIDYKTMNNGVKAQPERVPVMRLFGCDIFKVPCDSDCRDQPPA